MTGGYLMIAGPLDGNDSRARRMEWQEDGRESQPGAVVAQMLRRADTQGRQGEDGARMQCSPALDANSCTHPSVSARTAAGSHAHVVENMQVEAALPRILTGQRDVRCSLP